MVSSGIVFALWTALAPSPESVEDPGTSPVVDVASDAASDEASDGAPEAVPDEAVDASVAARLMAELSPHDRLAMGCVGPATASVDQLAASVAGTQVVTRAGPLSATFTAAVDDGAPRPEAGLVWMKLGDDPLVGAQTRGNPAPLALGDRWTDHWTESPRIRVMQNQTVVIAPHGRTPAPGQDRPEQLLASGDLSARGCVAWSRLPDRQARSVERLMVLSEDQGTLRVFAPSARAADASPRVETWAFTPSSRRRPQAVMVVYTPPHIVSGAPWLQETALPKRMSGLSSLIPSGYTAAPGQVRAWFDDVVGAAMAVVIPVVDDVGRPAEVTTLLTDVRDRFALSGEVEPEGSGGRLGVAGGVSIGALPGALVLSTDAEILVDMLHRRGTEWARPPGDTTAAAAWWLAPRDGGSAVGGRLTIEDSMWRVDARGGLDALNRATDWAGI